MTITGSDRHATDRAAETAKGAIDQAAAWAGEAAGDRIPEGSAERMADAAKRTVDAASSAVRQTADAAWGVAQDAKDRAADTLRDGYRRSQDIGRDVVERTQEQPVAAILTALTAGVVIGFALSLMVRAR